MSKKKAVSQVKLDAAWAAEHVWWAGHKAAWPLRATSRTCHDYVTHVFPDGAEYSLDGGLDYCKISFTDGFNHARVVSQHLSVDDDMVEIYSGLLWKQVVGKSVVTRPLSHLSPFRLRQAIKLLEKKQTYWLSKIKLRVAKFWLVIRTGEGIAV